VAREPERQALEARRPAVVQEPEQQAVEARRLAVAQVFERLEMAAAEARAVVQP